MSPFSWCKFAPIGFGVAVELHHSSRIQVTMRYGLTFRSIAVLFALSLAPAASYTPARPCATTGTPSSREPYARLTVGRDGLTRSFEDARDRTEYLDTRAPGALHAGRRGKTNSLVRGLEAERPDVSSAAPGSRRVSASGPARTISLRVISATQINVDELVFVNLPSRQREVARVQERKEHSETINVCATIASA